MMKVQRSHLCILCILAVLAVAVVIATWLLVSSQQTTVSRDVRSSHDVINETLIVLKRQREALEERIRNLTKEQDQLEVTSTSDVSDKRPGDLIIKSVLRGGVFAQNNKIIVIKSTLVTSVVHSFSKETEQTISKMFEDPVGEIKYYATGPAITWYKGSLVLVQRLWDPTYERKFFEKIPSVNTWPENYFYTQQFNDLYESKGKGHLLGIPFTTNCRFEQLPLYRTDGPMDPRLFTLGGRLYVLFHMWKFGQDGYTEGRMHVWDYEDNSIAKFEIDGVKMMVTEINWVPLDINGTLYFVYSFDPLRILTCSLIGRCRFVYQAKGAESVEFDPKRDHLRGGTPFVIYQWPYYISVAHSQLVIGKNKTLFYESHIVLLRVAPDFRIVYVSNPIAIHQKLLDTVEIVRKHTIKRPFVFPLGIIVWTNDVIDISAHVNDHNGYVIRFHGVEKILLRVLALDRTNPGRPPPNVRDVQGYVASSFQYLTGTT